MRALTLEKLIAIANEAYLNYDFSTCLLFIEGLQSPYVTRLLLTWDQVSAHSKEILADLLTLKVYNIN